MKYSRAKLSKIRDILPKIRIGDDWYLVDPGNHQFINAQDHNKWIDANSLPLTEDGSSYRFYFDPQNGVVIPAKTNGSLLVMIPLEIIQDPAGIASIGQQGAVCRDSCLETIKYLKDLNVQGKQHKKKGKVI